MLALAMGMAMGSAASADPGDKGHRARGGEARAEMADLGQSPSPPPRSAPGGERRLPDGPRDRAAVPVPAWSEPSVSSGRAMSSGREARAGLRPDTGSRLGDADGNPAVRAGPPRRALDAGFTPPPRSPRADGRPDRGPRTDDRPGWGGPFRSTSSAGGQPAAVPGPADPLPGGDVVDRALEPGFEIGDVWQTPDGRGRQDGRPRRDGSIGPDRADGAPGRGVSDGVSLRDQDQRRDGAGRAPGWRDDRGHAGRAHPRYRWHWRHDPRWRFHTRWGFYDPLWRFNIHWGWYDPRWGWDPRLGYDPRWGWRWPHAFDWRLGVRAETVIDHDPVLRRWALASFDWNRDGWLDPRERRAAAQTLEDVADLDGNRRLDARELAFARAEIGRFGWGPWGTGVGFSDGWP